MDKIDPCDTQRNNLIAAALGLQQCTKTDGTEVLIPGTGKRILIGGDAYLAKVAAPAATTASVSIDALLEAHAAAAIAAHEHGETAGYYHDLRTAEKAIRDVCQAPAPSRDADVGRDAARYRHIRNLTVKQAGAPGQPSIALPNGMNSGYYITEETADYAIDESIKELALRTSSTDTGSAA